MERTLEDMYSDLEKSQLAILRYVISSRGDCVDISCIGCPFSTMKGRPNGPCTNEYVYSKAKELLLEKDPSYLFGLFL